MPAVRRILVRWLLLSSLATVLCLLLYVIAQQIWRQLADDPQLQMARDAAAALADGQPPDAVVPSALVDMSRSLAPFVTVLTDAGAVVASSGRLYGQPRTVPKGVLDYVRTHREERVTWKPEPGVRIATIVVRNPLPPTGFVVVGRSLDETERRIARFGSLIGMAWMAIVAGLLLLVSMTDRVS